MADEQATPTDDVVLRDVIEGDLSFFFEHQLDPEATRMAAFPTRDRAAFMAHWARILGDATSTNTKQTIVFEGRVAGNIVSFEQSGETDVGYWLGREYWGRGIATKALAAFLLYVKSRPLYAHVAKHNVASMRVLEKCGFTISGYDTGSSGDGIEEVILRLGECDGEATP
jgi:RimJ/RimL family protein N-acetyltransferase